MPVLTEKNPWTTLNIQTPYENPWIKITHHEVLNPSGKEGIYGVIHYKNYAVGILPLDEHYNTWLVGQYRYPLDLYTWEIPEGGCPLGTNTLDTAKRELEEETGLTAKKWTPLLETHLSNSVSDEYGIIYIAQDLDFGKAMPEETEEICIKKLPFDTVFEMVTQGEITDSLTIMAILKAKFWINKRKI